jgi:sodium-dependent phosphate cotransporter
LGSNIGTTTTSILASFAAEGKYLKPSIQIAMVHLFFNVIGILIFYPIPAMRWPIVLAKHLGDLTAQYRWFAAVYLVGSFFLLPSFVFALSTAGLLPLYVVFGGLTLLLASVGFVNLLQRHRPQWLPACLRSWDFLPLWMRSLKPLDDFFARLPCCRRCTGAQANGDDPLPDVELALRADYTLVAQEEVCHVDKIPRPGFHCSLSKTPLVTDLSAEYDDVELSAGDRQNNPV